MDDDPTRFAWTSATAALRLPVYYHWEFATGEVGDFAALARRLRTASLPLPREISERPPDATHPGWQLPDVPDLRVQLLGALQALDYQPAPLPTGAATFAGALTDLFARAAREETPPLPPPLYGALQTGHTRLEDAPSWMRELNLDPRLRAIAGLGMEMVRRNQDAFVEATWRELGDAEAANQIIRQAQLAALVQRRLRERHVRPLDDGEIVQLTRPFHINTPANMGAHNLTYRLPGTPSELRKDRAAAAALGRVRKSLERSGRRIPPSGAEGALARNH